VKGSVTIVLDDVPWDQALAIVLDNNGLACTLQGNVLRIATLDTMKTEAEARRAQQEAQALAVPKQTITRYLSYGHSRDAMPVIKKFLSARGDVVADERSNALIVEDIQENNAGEAHAILRPAFDLRLTLLIDFCIGELLIFFKASDSLID